MTEPTTTDHANAAIAALSAVLKSPAQALRPDAVLALVTKPHLYVEIVAERRYLLSPLATPGSGIKLWRLTATWVADDVENADVLEAACHAALEDVVLTIGGRTTTPIQHELTEPTGQGPRDSGTWTGFVELTYAL